MPSQPPSCERKNRPNDFSFDASNHANRVLTFEQANCKLVMIMTVSAPFDKVFTQKKVRKTTNGNLVAMHQARNVELAAVEKKNLNRQF